MKKFNKLFKSILSIAMAFVFIFGVGCSDGSKGGDDVTIVPKPPVEEAFSLDKTSLDVIVGSTVSLELKEYNKDSENPITWTSSNELVAKVQETDVKTIIEIEGISEGDATITVTQGTLTATCAVSSTFGESSAEVVLSVADEFNIQSNSGFNLNPKIKFNGKTYDDGEFTYDVADKTNFSIDENGVLVGTASGVTTDVTIKGAWRGKDSDDMRLLEKLVTVNVIDSVSLAVEEYSGGYAQVYTFKNFDGKEYENTIDFTPVVYVNDQIQENANVSVVGDDKITYNDNQITGKYAGESVVTITYTDNGGKTLSKTFLIEVLRPDPAYYSGNIEYFSAASGTLRDPDDNFVEKTLAQYLYPDNDNEAIISAKLGDTALTVKDNRVLGVTPASTTTCEQTVTIDTRTSTYHVDLTVYGQYVYEAKDLDVFVRTPESLQYSGYVELAKDIDASNYKAGAHFPGVAGSAADDSYYPNTTTGQTYTAGRALYSGLFDGKGHTINGLTVAYNPNHVTMSGAFPGMVAKDSNRHRYGIFAALEGATIKNVAFTNTTISSRAMFGLYAKDTNFENIRIDVKSLEKFYYSNVNLLTTFTTEGGTLKNIYVTIPSSFDIVTSGKEANYFASSLAAIPVDGTAPTYENVVVVSKLPVGYSIQYQPSSLLCYAQNDSAEYKEKIDKLYWNSRCGSDQVPGKAIRAAWQAHPDYDPNINDYTLISKVGRAKVLSGVYRFDTLDDLTADSSISSVLSRFSTEFWTVSGNTLTWGAN